MIWVKVILIACVVLFLLYLYFIKPGDVDLPQVKAMREYDYAHRGLYDNESEAPENSIKAFQKAVQHGFGTELDVQLTKDGKLVVFHDKTLKRMCNVDRKLYECSFDELQRYHLMQSEETIPLFADVMSCVCGEIPVVIEVKSYHEWEKISEALCEQLATYEQEYQGAYSIVSANPLVLRWFKMNYPEMLRGQIVVGAKWSLKKGKKKYLKRAPIMYLFTNILSRPNYLSYNVGYLNNISFQICTKLFGISNLNWPTHSQEELEMRKNGRDMVVFEWFVPKRKEK